MFCAISMTSTLFVAIVSKRTQRMHPQTATEIERAFSRLLPGPDGRPPKRRVLALALDQESRSWLANKSDERIQCRDVQSCVFVEEFFVGNMQANRSMTTALRTTLFRTDPGRWPSRLRDYFDAGLTIADRRSRRCFPSLLERSQTLFSRCHAGRSHHPRRAEEHVDVPDAVSVADERSGKRACRPERVPMSAGPMAGAGPTSQ